LEENLLETQMEPEPRGERGSSFLDLVKKKRWGGLTGSKKEKAVKEKKESTQKTLRTPVGLRGRKA